ncbi:MAG TPA: carboxypeptidase regulatory-like domain-containing protein, partial [Blastocatellia bacterium]|nr:carboxypeptidase regulatory-like domain-containing protein [Blastocatellia bacterium]
MKLTSRDARCRIACLGTCLFFIITSQAPAQTAGTGALAGTVADPNGAVIAEVRVTITNEVTGESRSVLSLQNGNYTIPLLQPGRYAVEFIKPGFKKAIKNGLRINVTETARLDVQLEIGAVQEQVNVAAGAQLLQTESSALGRVTDREVINDLPLVTRNYTQIVSLSPGVATNVNNATQLGRGNGGLSQGDFRAHGASGADNNFLMNGIQINDLQASGNISGGVAIPNPDAIQEFKVQTGLYDATYGRNTGANVNVVTRSGANNFHGSVFEYLRNDALNANEFFRNKAGQPRGVLKQNQFGFTLGGPVKKDALLFFTSYQGTRQINGVGGGGTSSFFSPPFTDDRSRAALGRMFGGQPGALGGVTVAANGSNISSQALALLNLKLPNGQFAIPSPQTINPAQPLALQGFSSFSVPATFDEDQFLVNLDYLHTARSKLAGRFFFADSSQILTFPPSQIAATAPGFPLLTDTRMINLSLAHTYTLSATLLNQAEFGFHRIASPTIQQEVFKFSDVGIKAPATANDFPAIGVNGSLALGGNGQGLELNQNHFTIQDTVTYIRGRHTFRLGGGITRSQVDLADFHFFGGLLFLSWPDFLLGLPGGPVAAGGNGSSFSNVFLSIDIPGLLDRAWRLNDANAFLQDDIKLTSSFTLNLGVRYERLANLGDKLGRNSGFDIALANPNPPAAGTVEGFVVSDNFPGAAPAGVKQLDNNYGTLGEHQNSLDPRFGFAWQAMRRMVVRGGYGIYHTRATGQPFIQLAAAPPFALLRQLQGAPNAGASFANPFGPDLTFPQFPAYSPATSRTISFIDQAYRPPVTQEFSFNIQTDLGRDFLLEVAYVGARGTHQIQNRSQNQALLASPSSPIRGETTNTFANIGKRVPILGFTAPGLNDIDSSASSWYHGLETSLTKRLSKGFQFLAAYTFSHAYSTTGRSTAAGGTSGISGNQNDSRANYGRSEFNREHRFVASYLYQLPSPARFDAISNALLGGWSVAGVTTFQSGLPLTLTGTNGNNVFGITNDRAHLAPGCNYADLTTAGPVNGKLDNYFNKGCILRNAASAAAWPVVGSDGRATGFGNSGVGVVFGPDQRNFDIVLIKRTPVTRLRENANIELRTEFFNAFNTTQFGNPATNVSASTFG